MKNNVSKIEIACNISNQLETCQQIQHIYLKSFEPSGVSKTSISGPQNQQLLE